MKKLQFRPDLSFRPSFGGICVIVLIGTLLLDLSMAFVGPQRERPFAVAFRRWSFADCPTWGRVSSLRVSTEDDFDDNDSNPQEEFFVDTIGGIDSSLSRKEIESLTVVQLKQQLRLRGLSTQGRKQALVDRLLGFSMESLEENMKNALEVETDRLSVEESKKTRAKKSKAQKLAEENGKVLVDVSAYLEGEDIGKTFKSSTDPIPEELKQIEAEKAEEEDQDNPETWGTDARIVDDYEGRSPVVDVLMRTVVEFRGSNQSVVEAYVVASRDAMKPFLAGGHNRTGEAEARLREIQVKREQASKRHYRPDGDEGVDEGDDDGFFKDILNRDYTDWGSYTVTGAQLSAEEVQGVLFLSDVYGAFNEDTQLLADKIAFECQPVVVMVPDLFQGEPWQEDSTTPGFNEKGQDYEEWRAQHPDTRVSIDIRASAAILREKYGVSSIAVWGTCYGGGRALEVGAGYLPDGCVHDVDGSIGPLPVDPTVVVAWYPTRYCLADLYGPNRTEYPTNDPARKMAVMAVFAGKDKLPGATREDAEALKKTLEADERIKDCMVKVFADQDHGFAHIGLSQADRLKHEDDEFDRFVEDEFGGSGRVSFADSEADVACLLSTAFMESYGRVFLPTTGSAISKDENEENWNSNIDMDLYGSSGDRDVRAEIDDSVRNFKDIPLEGLSLGDSDVDRVEGFIKYLRSIQPEDYEGPHKIEEDDSIDTMLTKLQAADPSFQLF